MIHHQTAWNHLGKHSKMNSIRFLWFAEFSQNIEPIEEQTVKWVTCISRSFGFLPRNLQIHSDINIKQQKMGQILSALIRKGIVAANAKKFSVKVSRVCQRNSQNSSTWSLKILEHFRQFRAVHQDWSIIRAQGIKRDKMILIEIWRIFTENPLQNES